MSKIKIRSYKKNGDKEQEFFYDEIQTALKKYVEIRNNISNYQDSTSLWPTIWINTDCGFRRVHDFTFKSISSETIINYLNERILDTDDLLAQF